MGGDAMPAVRGRDLIDDGPALRRVAETLTAAARPMTATEAMRRDGADQVRLCLALILERERP